MRLLPFYSLLGVSRLDEALDDRRQLVIKAFYSLLGVSMTQIEKQNLNMIERILSTPFWEFHAC